MATLAGKKRALDESSPDSKNKKRKGALIADSLQETAIFPRTTKDIDFPRGGGTTFTPLEVKMLRSEAAQEADAELFKNAPSVTKKMKRKQARSEDKPTERAKDRLRVEHLNYKRITAGMKIFGQIANILPLALIISLPNQLYGHVPITNISTQFTEGLERIDAQDSQSDDEEDDLNSTPLPELSDMFTVGQYVRATVSALHPPGTTDVSGIGRYVDENAKASRRVELSLAPQTLNVGVQMSDLKPGYTLSAAVKSREDHGYVLDFGIQGVSGFVSFKDVDDGRQRSRSLCTGELLDVTVQKVSGNGRICTVNTSSPIFASSYLSEISSVTSILPGMMVQGLVTNVHPTGLNLQLLGYFDGTVERLHIGDASSCQVGTKVKGRILYEYSVSPPKFAVTLLDHIMNLLPRTANPDAEIQQSIQDEYPLGTVLQSVKVISLEADRGLIAAVASGVEGFVHISHTSDDHVPTLSSSGPWKVGSDHSARVTGYHPFDGLLQLSMKQSVINEKYLRVNDVAVGEIVRGTVKKLTETNLIVSLSGGIDAVVWPSHYADISLKHPSKRFKEGANIKCRVLIVDPDKKRIVLTAKKSLLESTLPIVATPTDVKPGLVTHGVVCKHLDKRLLVEFYGHLKALVPQREIGATLKSRLEDAFPIGRVLKLRILKMDEGRIIASLRQATQNFDTVTDLSCIEIGSNVRGTVAEVHKENLLLHLQGSNVRALLSLKNLANARNLPIAQTKANVATGETLDDLVVVSKDQEKALVIVANKPKAKASVLTKGANVKLDSVTPGQIVTGRVTRHTQNRALLKISPTVGGSLHLTDISDDFTSVGQLPSVDSIIRAAVVAIDVSKRQLSLSTRSSCMGVGEGGEVKDAEVKGLGDVQVGQTVRGFVKSITGHGIFVSIGRDVDARIQIRELFDEFVEDWQSRFAVGQVVKGRILDIDSVGKKVEMSLRSGNSTERKARISLSDLMIGQKVEGVVKKVEDYGLFVNLDGSKLSGLCHKSELSDNKDADVTVALKGFREGDKVKVVITRIENKRISLSLKPSLFEQGDLSDQEDGDDGDLAASLSDKSASEDDRDDPMMGVEDNSMNVDDSESDNDEVMSIAMDGNQLEYQVPPVVSKTVLPAHGPTLSYLGGFQWPLDASSINEKAEDSSSDDSDDAQPTTRKRRKRKEIEQDLTANMHTKAPESNADFERLLLGSPNSSLLWIQYMSFQLPLSDVRKAREIAGRAVKTISFREERERLNVWIALLNLENTYGTDESLQTAFKDAIRANDSKTVHLRLASIFEQSQKYEKAEEQYKRTCKKFSQSSKVWTSFAEFLLKKGEVEEARKLLPRSLQSLEKRKHLKTISRFAQLEYKQGDAERGKTIFEGIVDSHPKRWDMWSIYLDMEAGQGDIRSLRSLFERVLTLKMTSHKAKSFFKKWFELEKRIGDEDGANMVKEKATEWTRNAAASNVS